MAMDRSSIISRPSLLLSTPIDNQTQAVEATSSQMFTINGLYSWFVLSIIMTSMLFTGDQSTFTNEQGHMAIWVASNIDSIPIGSLIINPQTG